MTSIGRQDLSAWFEEGPSPTKAIGRGWHRFAKGLAKLAGLVGLTALALSAAIALVPGHPAASQAATASAESWVEVNRPIPMYGLAGTDFVRLPATYRARRLSASRGRVDILTFGDAHADSPFLALSFDRLGQSPVPLRTFAAEIDDVALDSGLGGIQAAATTPLATRFGPFEAADIRVTGDVPQTSCLGFRNSPNGHGVLRIAGLLCGGAGRPAARDSLGCVIDRIDLLGGADDPALQRIFVEAERRRGSACAPSRRTATGGRTTWLDANASLPVLRGSAPDAASRR